MTFSHAYLFAAADARLVYNVSGGQAERAFPPAKQAPANAVSATWDADTLMLTVLKADESTQILTLTTQEIEEAQASSAL